MPDLYPVISTRKPFDTDADAANSADLAPPPIPAPIDGIQAADPLPPELGGVDGRPAPAAGGFTGMLRAGVAALSQPFAANAPASAEATAFNAMSAAEQRDAVADMIVSDPAAAARYAESLAADSSAAGKQAYADYWKAVDAATTQGGPLFIRPEKAAEFLEAASTGSDRVAIDALDHVYAGFLAKPTYRGFATDELSALAGKMIAKLVLEHPGERGLVRAFAALQAHDQRAIGGDFARDYPAAAARFADEVGAVTKDGLDNFVEGASKDSAQFRDEWLLRTGTPAQRMDVLARYYPERFIKEVERYKTSNPERYHEYMQLLAKHNPDRFVEQLGDLRATNPALAARFETDLQKGEGPVFDAISVSRDPRMTDLKERAVDHFMNNEQTVAAYRLFIADPNTATYALRDHQAALAKQTEKLLRRDPGFAQRMMSDLASSYTKEVVGALEHGDEGRARLLATDLGTYIGIVHGAAMSIYSADPKRGRSVIENVVRGAIKIAGKFHKGAKVLDAAVELIDLAAGLLRDLKDDSLSKSEIASRFQDVMVRSAVLTYHSESGDERRSIGERDFRTWTFSGFDMHNNYWDIDADRPQEDD